LISTNFTVEDKMFCGAVILHSLRQLEKVIIARALYIETIEGYSPKDGIGKNKYLSTKKGNLLLRKQT
jgi:hypothetical protein